MLRYSSCDEICVGYEANINESRGSENSSAADNQQERLVKIGWISGFVDGEGCFSIHFVRQAERLGRKGYRTGYQVGHEFAVTQGAKSVECLRMLKLHFGVGKVYRNRRHDNHKEDLYRFSVARRNDLIKVIIPFFEKHALRTSKRFDFMKFAECVRLMQFDVHLSPRGLIRIAEIAETMNHCKSRSKMIRILRDYMPNADKTGEDIVPSAWRHAGAK